MFSWLKSLQYVVKNYSVDLFKLKNRLDMLEVYVANQQARIQTLEHLIREHTNIAVDVGFRDGHHVIVVGHLKGADYVQTFAVQEQDIAQLVGILKDMERYGKVVRIDAMPYISACIKNEFKEPR